MAAGENDLFDYYSDPTSQRIRGYIDSTGSAQITLGLKPVPKLSQDANGNVTGLVGPSGRKTNIQSVRSKFLASLPQGANYRSGKSILAAPAWAAGVIVTAGYICQSGGNLYAAVQVGNVNSAGVVTANVPSGTGMAPIIGADGIPWLYCGVADAALSDTSDAPAISHATVPASCTSAVMLSATPQGWSPGSGQQGTGLDPYNSSNYWLTGSDFAWASGAGGGVNGIAAVNYGSSATVDFITDAPIISMNKTQQYGGRFFNFTVNGYPLFPKYSAAYPFAAFNSLTNGSLVFDWTAKPNKPRRVRFPILSSTFTGIFVPPQYNVWAPVNPNRYRLYLEGDSFTQGGASGDGYANQVCHRIGAMLGCDDVWTSAVGGGGYLKVSNNGDTIVSRAPKVIAAAPDILYCMPTGWDQFYTSAQRQAAYVSYFTTLLAALPNLIIIASGDRGVPNYSVYGGGTTGYNIDADMVAAVATMNNPHVRYLDATGGVASAVVPGAGMGAGALTVAELLALGVSRMWWSGTGTAVGQLDGNPYNVAGNQQWNTGSWTSTGGANTDGHPNVRGLEVLQWQIFNGIVSVMNSLTD